jgi:hypothetical protein
MHRSITGTLMMVSGIACAAGDMDPVRSDRPLEDGSYAEISLAQGVGVWEAFAIVVETRQVGDGEESVESAVGLSVTDYASIGNPFWVKPGRVQFTYGCPWGTNDYDTKQELVVPEAGRYTLRCDAGRTLMLDAVRD